MNLHDAFYAQMHSGNADISPFAGAITIAASEFTELDTNIYPVGTVFAVWDDSYSQTGAQQVNMVSGLQAMNSGIIADIAEVPEESELNNSAELTTISEGGELNEHFDHNEEFV